MYRIVVMAKLMKVETRWLQVEPQHSSRRSSASQSDRALYRGGRMQFFQNGVLLPFAPRCLAPNTASGNQTSTSHRNFLWFHFFLNGALLPSALPFPKESLAQ